MNDSRREKILNLVGLGLVLLCFCLSLFRQVARFSRRETADGKMTLRFAHWQLESGLRDAFDRLAADYMRLHPDVRVEQLPIPESVYPNWLRTQLIGGTAPEMIEFGLVNSNEILANYFVPLTPYLEHPNPYNKGNDLAETPWRETFVGALGHDYNQELLEYYSIPNTVNTIRMFYNRPLWRAVFGSEEVPRTYEELLACCQRAAAYRTASGEPILPIAGAQGNSPYLLQRLFSSQTQRLFYSLAPPGSLYPTHEQLALEYLAGQWSFRDPAVLDGMELARSVGQFLPTGFLQLKREDALFTFTQGRALMTITGSWDAPSIHSQAPFEVGVFNPPVPTTRNPRYGHNVYGPVSESGGNTSLSFAVVRQPSAAKMARIIDFLHFMTSRDSNSKFSADSGWLPAVVGAAVQPAVRPFLPRTEGYPAGFGMGITQEGGTRSFGTETGRIRDASMYRLYEPDGGPSAYVDAMAENMRPAVISDLTKIHRDQLEAIERQDTTLEAWRVLGADNAANGSEKFDELNELQTQEEMTVASRRWRLRQLGLTVDR